MLQHNAKMQDGSQGPQGSNAGYAAPGSSTVHGDMGPEVEIGDAHVQSVSHGNDTIVQNNAAQLTDLSGADELGTDADDTTITGYASQRDDRPVSSNSNGANIAAHSITDMAMESPLKSPGLAAEAEFVDDSTELFTASHQEMLSSSTTTATTVQHSVTLRSTTASSSVYEKNEQANTHNDDALQLHESSQAEAHVDPVSDSSRVQPTPAEEAAGDTSQPAAAAVSPQGADTPDMHLNMSGPSPDSASNAEGTSMPSDSSAVPNVALQATATLSQQAITPSAGTVRDPAQLTPIHIDPAQQLPSTSMQLAHVLSVDVAKRNNLHAIEDNVLLMAVGNMLMMLDLQTMQQRYVPGIDAGGVACVAVHPSRQCFAVAEKCRSRPPNL